MSDAPERYQFASIYLTGPQLDALNMCLSVVLNDPYLFNDRDRLYLGRVLDKVQSKISRKDREQ